MLHLVINFQSTENRNTIWFPTFKFVQNKKKQVFAVLSDSFIFGTFG